MTDALDRYLERRLQDEDFAKAYEAEQEHIRLMQTPIAYVTKHGELMCCECLQPTVDLLENELLVITALTPGKPEPCDACGKEVKGVSL